MKHLIAFALFMTLLAGGLPTNAQEDDALSWDEIILHGHRALNAGDVESALSSFRTANDMVQGRDDQAEEQIVALTSLGLLYTTIGELVLAGDYHDQSLALRLETYGEPSHQVAIGLRNLASVRQNQGQMAETSTLLNRALSNLEGVGEGEGDDALGVRRD
ncbi:MAG: tetratricopeptide repeat protein, partial [Alphaproteobacteria bacterium]